MLKVCGITYTHTSNYGSCLQAYALQNAVERIDVDGVLCQYRLIPIGAYKSFRWRTDGLSWMRRMRLLCIRVFFAMRRRSFASFEKTYIHYSNCSSLEMLPSLNCRTDAFVCGSDVVWNPHFNNGCGAFYLDFVKKYCFSYAASFGTSHPHFSDRDIYNMDNMMTRINAISVREIQSVEVLKRFTDKPVFVAVDPVLLLTKESWNKVAETRKKDEKYIFVYTTYESKILKEFVKKIQKRTGLRIISTVGNPNPKGTLKQGAIALPSPQKWLRLIRDAEYIITNSFHGTAFSVLFHKRFFVPVSGEINEGSNVRVYSFLQQVGLTNRMVNKIIESIDDSMPDYSTVDKQLEEMREASLAFLRDNLEAAYRQKLKNESSN